MVNLVQHLRILYLTVFLVWAWIVCHKHQPSTFCRPQTISDMSQQSELVERLRTQHLFEAGCIRSYKWASTSELSEVHSLGSSLQNCSASIWYEMPLVSRRGSGFSKTFGIFLAVHSGEESLRAFTCFFAWFDYSSGTLILTGILLFVGRVWELSRLSPDLALTDEPDYNGWMGRRALRRAGPAAQAFFELKSFGIAWAVRGELESCSWSRAWALASTNQGAEGESSPFAFRVAKVAGIQGHLYLYFFAILMFSFPKRWVSAL